MKVLILGGTGAMGTHLVKLLSEIEAEIVVTSRQSRKSSTNVRYIQGNARDIVFLQSLLKEKWDVIIDFMTYTTSIFKERVELMLNATSQYVFLSTARVYADSKKGITEYSSRLLDVSHDKKFLATDDYPITKARQEDILKNSGRTNWTIIRPYITYGESRLQLGVLEKEDWLYRALHGRTIVFSSDINSKVTTLTYGLDVSKGIMAIIGNSKALGDIFHITSHKSTTWSMILEVYLLELEKHLGYRPKVLLQDLDNFLECSNKYQVVYDRLFDRKFDNSKISHYVNVEDFVKSDEGIKICLKEFLEKPHFKSINWRMEAKRDRQTGEKTSLKEIKGYNQKLHYIIYRYSRLLNNKKRHEYFKLIYRIKGKFNK